MSIGILLATQTKIGKSLLKAAETTYKTLPAPVKAFCVGCQSEPDNIFPKLVKLTSELDQGDGVLVLTDLYGSTASNLVHQLENHTSHKIKVVSGLNLPMLLKALNYASLSINEAAQKAIEGGHGGIRSSDDQI